MFLLLNIKILLSKVKKKWMKNPTRSDRHPLWRLISRKLWKIGTWNFWYNLHSSLQFMLLKFGFDIFDSLETMRFSATRQFHHNFKIEWKFWILIVASEIPSSYLSKYILLHIKKKNFIYKNQFLGKKLTFLRYLWRFFFQTTSKVHWFYKFWWLHWKDLKI